MLKVAGKPFGGFATEPLFSALPMANGPYAVRVRLLPAASNGTAAPGASEDWAADFSPAGAPAAALGLAAAVFRQRRAHADRGRPVNWPTPYTTVARLMLPRQDTASPEGLALAQQIEATVFDPWQALAEHRPLGDVQRARKVVYFESQKGRGAA